MLPSFLNNGEKENHILTALREKNCKMSPQIQFSSYSVRVIKKTIDHQLQCFS